MSSSVFKCSFGKLVPLQQEQKACACQKKMSQKLVVPVLDYHPLQSIFNYFCHHLATAWQLQCASDRLQYHCAVVADHHHWPGWLAGDPIFHPVPLCSGNTHISYLTIPYLTIYHTLQLFANCNAPLAADRLQYYCALVRCWMTTTGRRPNIPSIFHQPARPITRYNAVPPPHISYFTVS